jgi:hypothetical protein
MSTSKFSSSLVFVLVSLFALGCDDPEKAQDKCEALVTTVCEHVVECAQRAGLLDASYTANDLRNECESSIADNAHCEDAVRVSKNFNQCVDDASTLSCSDITDGLQDGSGLPMPNSCQGAVLYVD